MEHKPSYDEWLRLAQALQARLERVCQLYKDDQQKSVGLKWKTYLDRLQHLTSGGSAVPSQRPPASLQQQIQAAASNTARYDDLQIQQLYELFEQLLPHMPFISRDMQQLLGCPWGTEPRGYIAAELFHGERGTKHGLGSGYAEDGYLPGLMDDIMHRELRSKGDRPPRQGQLSAAELHKREQTGKMWAEQNNWWNKQGGLD